jgi:monothiol glutaredoxin
MRSHLAKWAATESARACAAETKVPFTYPEEHAMPRHTLDPSRIHPAIADRVANAHVDVVQNVQSAVASNAVLVVGMATNPFCKRARKALDAAGVAHHYLEYGSYLSQWRQRNALKMWTGWPTFPMVFVKGVLVGGADDLKNLIESGELKRVLAA